MRPSITKHTDSRTFYRYLVVVQKSSREQDNSLDGHIWEDGFERRPDMDYHEIHVLRIRLQRSERE